MIGSVVYPVGHVVPDGPVGADAEAFSSFAVGRTHRSGGETLIDLRRGGNDRH